MDNSEQLKKINEVSKALSKPEDIRGEMEMIVGPNTSWEDFLTPAPMCICLLGELMVISTATDFTLEKNPPKDGFKLINWPNSFRASLTQVTNAGWTAFNAAHKNMDQIRLMSSNVPKHLRDAIKILLQGDDDELEDLLPIPLLAIKDTADKCLNLASSVEDKFEHVMDLTGEILEACVGAKGAYENELKEVNAALIVAKQKKKTAEEQKEMAKKSYLDLQKTVQKTEAAYDKSLESMPGGWKTISLNIAEGISNSFTTAVSGITRIATLGLGSSGSKDKSMVEKIFKRGEKNGASTETAKHIDEKSVQAYSSSSKLKSFASSLMSACLEDDKLKGDLSKEE